MDKAIDKVKKAKDFEERTQSKKDIDLYEKNSAAIKFKLEDDQQLEDNEAYREIADAMARLLENTTRSVFADQKSY